MYCILCVWAAQVQARRRDLCSVKDGSVGISVLKPLAGAEPRLASNLRLLFEQDYSRFEILFAVSDAADPAAVVARELMERYPHVPSRLLVVGDSEYPNPKVYGLSRMAAIASYRWLVMSDSDVGLPKGFLRGVSREIGADRYELATCPYRSVPAPSMWSLFEALELNTSFWGGSLVAKRLEGMKFAVGPTVIARRDLFDRIPWEKMGQYYADDFALGNLAHKLGFRVDLSQLVVEHHLGLASFRSSLDRRVRWARSTRRSRPWGYIGQVFTNPIPIALALALLDARFWPALPVTLCLRAASARAVSQRNLSDPVCRRWWPLIPVQDLFSFIIWLAGFSGRTIAWRGHNYRLNHDGTVDLVA